MRTTGSFWTASLIWPRRSSQSDGLLPPVPTWWRTRSAARSTTLCVDWRHLHELLSAARDVYSELKNLCVWNTSNAGMGSLYRSKHELVVDNPQS
jgi:hypothetical protein